MTLTDGRTEGYAAPNAAGKKEMAASEGKEKKENTL